MKNIIYKISTLLLVVCLLSDSWALAASVQRTPAQAQTAQNETEGLSQAGYIWELTKLSASQLIHGLSWGIFEKKSAEQESETKNETTEEAAQKERIAAQEALLKAYGENMAIVNNTQTLLNLNEALVGRIQYELQLSERLNSLFKQREQRKDLQTGFKTQVTLLRSQTDSMTELLTGLVATGQADLQFLREFQNKNVEVAQMHPQLFELFKHRANQNQHMFSEISRIRNEIYAKKQNLTPKGVAASAVNANALYLEYDSLKTSAENLIAMMARYSENPFVSKQSDVAAVDAKNIIKSAQQQMRILRQIDNRIASEEGRNKAAQKLHDTYNKDLNVFFRAENIFLLGLSTLSKTDKRQADFLFKVREVLPKTTQEHVKAIPGNIKKDAQRFSNFTGIRQVVEGTKTAWGKLFGTDSSTKKTPTADIKEEVKVTAAPNNSKETDLSWKYSGKDLWDVVNSVWGKLRSEGYVPHTTANVEGKVIDVNPVKVTLTTSDLNELPQEIREIEFSTLSLLARRGYFEQGISEGGKDTILLVKNSSITRNEEVRTKNVKVTQTVDANNNNKRRVVVIEAMNGEKVTLDYTVDPEIATKTASPMALTSLRKNFTQSTKHAIYKFPVEAPPFYLGLLANTWINFLVRYDSDPKAFERFFHELTSVEGQLGFAGFMVGNHFGSTLLREMLNIKNEVDMVRRSMMTRMFITNFSMALGSVFSNITADLLSITKPCALDRWKNSLNDERNESDVSKVCQEAWDAVVNSDKIHQYIQTSLTVMAAAIGAAGIQSLAALAVKGGSAASTTFNGIAVMFQDFWKTNTVLNKSLISEATIARYAKIGMPVRMTPAGIVVTAAHLILFFQSDAFANPIIHKYEETFLNTGTKLATKRDGLLRAQKYLDNTNFSAGNCDPKSYDNMSVRQNPYSAHDQMYTQQTATYVESCQPIATQIQDFKKASDKWRGTLMYKFNMAYFAWQEVFSEFKSQVKVLNEFYKELSYYADNNPAIGPTKAKYFNPLFHEDPFYGVIPYVEPKEQNDSIFKSGLDKMNDVLQTAGQKSSLPEDMIKPIEIQMHPNENEVEFAEGFDPKSENPAAIIKIDMEDAKIKRLMLAAQLIDKHLEALKTYAEGKTFRNKSLIERYTKDLTTIRNKFISYDPKTRDFTSLKEGLVLLKSTYDTFRKAYLTQVTGAGAGTARNVEGTTQNPTIRNSILSIYRFVGKPRPLQKGESFMIRFDDWAKANFGTFEHLLKRAGVNTISDAMLWYAVCGVDYNKNNNSVAHEARSVSLGVPLTGGDFSIEMQWWKSGTGLDFIGPRLLDPAFGDMPQFNCKALKKVHYDLMLKTSKPVDPVTKLALGDLNYGKIAFNHAQPFMAAIPNSMSANGGKIIKTENITEDSDVPVADKAKSTSKHIVYKDKNTVVVGQKTTRLYDNVLEFLIDNTAPEIPIKDNGAEAMKAWWNDFVTPKVDQTYLTMEDRYFDMVHREFGSTLYNNGKDFTYEKLFEGKTERTFYKLANSVSLAYVDEMDVYLRALQTVYNNMAKNKLAKLNQLKAKETRRSLQLELEYKILIANRDAQVFTYHLQMMKQSLVDMLFSLIATVQTLDKNSVTRGKMNSSTLAITDLFAPALVHYQEILRAFGFLTPTEQGLQTNYPQLYALLKLKDAEMSPYENGFFLLETDLNNNENLQKEVSDYSSEDNAENLMTYAINRPQVDPNDLMKMSQFDLLKLQLEDNRAQADAGLKPRINPNAFIAEPFQFFPQASRMTPEQVEVRASVLKVDPAEKARAQLAYLATTAVYESMASAYNQITILKTGSARDSFEEATLTPDEGQKIGTPSSTRIFGQ